MIIKMYNSITVDLIIYFLPQAYTGGPIYQPIIHTFMISTPFHMVRQFIIIVNLKDINIGHLEALHGMVYSL